MSDNLQPHGLYSPWNSPGQNTEMCSLSFLQGIFPTQGLKPGLLHCGQILYQLSNKESPGILKWLVSLLRQILPTQNRTGVSCIADGFFTNYLTYPLVSPNFLNISLVFPILLFSSVSLYCSLKKVFYLSVLFSGTLHPIWYVLGKYYLSFLFYRKFITNFFQLHCFCLFF